LILGFRALFHVLLFESGRDSFASSFMVDIARACIESKTTDSGQSWSREPLPGAVSESKTTDSVQSWGKGTSTIFSRVSAVGQNNLP
jgi:hypothetical protein